MTVKISKTTLDVTSTYLTGINIVKTTLAVNSQDYTNQDLLDQTKSGIVAEGVASIWLDSFETGGQLEPPI
jgi:hypothetical protein